MVTIPLAGFALLRSETNGFEFYNFRRFSCYLFILILLSSGVFTPLSISSSYWPNAYAQEFDESVSVVPSSDTKVKGKPADNEPKGKPADSTVPEFDESVSVVPSNGTSTEIQEFDESISVVPSNSTIIEIPEPTISLDFDYDLTKKFTDEEYNDSLELDGEEDFLQINENSTDSVSYLTLTAWVKPDYSNGSPEFTVISKEKSFSLTINNNIQPEKIAKFSVFDGIKWTTVESTGIVDEEWTFLAVTFDGDSIGIGVNNGVWET